MSKLFVSIATLGAGGAERVLSVLSPHLADGFDMVQYILWDGGEPFYTIDQRVVIVSLPQISGKQGRRHQMGAFRRLIKSERPDLVLSFLTPYNMLVLLSTMGMKQKVVVAERTDPRRLLSGGKAGLWLRDWLYHWAAGILTQTDYAKSCYDKKFAEKTKVIYNPVTMRDEQVGMALRAEKKHVFVTAGRLEPVKDQSMMIEAFAEFHQSHSDYRLVVYGEGPIRDELQNKIDFLGLHNTIILAGSTNELWENISCAEAFLLTSKYEGMSNALIEAMCLGLPVVSTKVAGATDLIEDGKNGFLIDVGDKKSLADRMTCLADRPDIRLQMGQRASEIYELVRQDKITKQWVDYLKSKI